jgi:oligosaccharyltransferase complex subunit beta
LHRFVTKMRNVFLLALLALLNLVLAVSSSGDRLLVVLEDKSEKAAFSQFWTDLEGIARALPIILPI